MQQITQSKTYPNGVRVFRADAGKDLFVFFSCEDLIDLEVNVPDLLNNPGIERVNVASHTIEPAVSGCGFASGTCEDEIVITLLFGAPRDLTWRAWTEPDSGMHWWGPRGYTSPSCTIDLRVGGKYLSCIRSPEGKDFWSTGVYREIKQPERIVCTDRFADENGNVVPATYYGMSTDVPLEMPVTVTFDVHAGRTQLPPRHAGIPAGDMRDIARAGWNESLDRFAGVPAQAVYNNNVR